MSYELNHISTTSVLRFSFSKACIYLLPFFTVKQLLACWKDASCQYFCQTDTLQIYESTFLMMNSLLRAASDTCTTHPWVSGLPFKRGWQGERHCHRMTISASRDLRRELCLFVLKLNFIKITATKMPRAQCPLHWYHAWCESSTAAGKVFIEEAQKLTQGCVFNMRSHPLSASF